MNSTTTPTQSTPHKISEIQNRSAYQTPKLIALSANEGTAASEVSLGDGVRAGEGARASGS